MRAKTVAVPGSTSGICLVTTLFPQLGIAGEIRVTVTERGSQAAAMVAAGDADLAVQPLSEITNVPGVEVVGRIPDDVQLVQTFAAAIVEGSRERDAAARLIAFLASERASAAIVASGMDR